MTVDIDQLAILTPKEMGQADQLTIDDGTPGYTLMKAAGIAILEVVTEIWPDADHITIVCGPGNNGGDGFVAAELLKSVGKQVQLGLLGNPEELTGDAALAYADWSGDTQPADTLTFRNTGVIIDALFGAGLSRPLAGDAASIVQKINDAAAPILSVDLPSGVDGRTGSADGIAISADVSVSFFRKKPGHFLWPGREHCGATYIADIGIEPNTLARLNIQLYENTPGLWSHAFPAFGANSHKFTKGHAVIVSGPALQTGASRLAAKAALRTGVGLVTLAGQTKALRIHAAHLTSIMLKEVTSDRDLDELLQDGRITALAIGPGLGLDPNAEDLVDTACLSAKKLILDADAITLLSKDRHHAFKRLSECPEQAILTPHEGEFRRLFPDIDDASKVERARQAAASSHSIVVLKGPDTVIAAPDGRAAINSNAPHWLGTAGSGDTLTGIIAGLRAQGMPAFEAACAGVWLHGDAGQRAGAYLTADELEPNLKDALAALLDR